MSFRNASPAEAYDALKEDPNAIYLDVRTEQEFAHGHPAGAINVPILFFEPQGGPPRQNDDFLEVVRHHVDPSRKLFIGCQSGARSQRAAAVLIEAGYESVTNVTGGFGGLRDRGGNSLADGWRDSGLPIENSVRSGSSYRDLLDQARK